MEKTFPGQVERLVSYPLTIKQLNLKPSVKKCFLPSGSYYPTLNQQILAMLRKQAATNYVFEWNKESREITEDLNFEGVIKLESHNHLNTKVSLLHSRMPENQLLPSSFSGVSQPLFPKSSLSSLE